MKALTPTRVVPAGLYIFMINVCPMETKTYTAHGYTRTLSEWAQTLGVNYKALYLRIHRRKWPLELALSVGNREIRRTTPAEERFWGKVDPFDRLDPDGCWHWTGARQDFGYGWFSAIPHKPEGAHRFSYKLHTGPIFDGGCVLHHCDNPPCVNPRHLFIGDRDLNNADMTAKGRRRNGQEIKTHCKQGHEFTPENTYLYKGKSRHCKTCAWNRHIARLAKKRANSARNIIK